MAQPAYDFGEDEKNEPVGFEQDPDSDDFGDGYFVYPDGSRKYASDPEQADKLSAAGKTTAPQQPGQGTGSLTQGGGADEPPPGADEEITDPGTRVSYAGDPSSPYANAVAANEGASGSAALGVQPPAQLPSGAPPSAAEKAQIAPTAEEQAKLGWKTPAVGDLQKPAGAPTPAVGNLRTPPSPIAPVAAPLGPPTAPAAPPASPNLPEAQNTRGASSSATASDTQSNTVSGTESRNASGSVSRTGSAMGQPQFEQQQGDVQKTYDAAIHGNQDAQNKLADLMAEHQAQMQQAGRDREAQTQAAIAQNEQRRKAATQKIQEIDSRPTDANKIWKDKGTLGTILGGLGVAMGSLYATRHGGPNTALESIEKQKQDSIKIQLADRDSELRGLERELGSLDAAVPVYEARMNGALAQQAQAMLTGEKSAQVRASGAQLINQLNVERQAKLAEGAKAYYGTIATQQAGQVGSQRTTGSTGTSTRGSQAGTENSDVYGAKGAEPEKRDADQAKASAVMAASDGQGKALALVRDKSGKWVPGPPGTQPGTDAEREAAHNALLAALTESGYKPNALDEAAPMTGDRPHFWTSPRTKPEDAAAALNALEAPMRERLNPTDRTRAGKRGYANDPGVLTINGKPR